MDEKKKFPVDQILIVLWIMMVFYYLIFSS